MYKPKPRFAFHESLTRDTPFMGGTAGEWDDALTGHGQFQKSLEVLKTRIAQFDLAKTQADPLIAVATLRRAWAGNESTEPFTKDELDAANFSLSLNARKS